MKRRPKWLVTETEVIGPAVRGGENGDGGSTADGNGDGRGLW